MSEATLHRWTHDDLARLPEDGKRYEIIRGGLCMTLAPSMRHQRVVARLHLLLGAFIEDHRLGELYMAPADVRLSEHDVVEPDLFFIRTQNLGIIGEDFVAGAPDLVIEVASDSTRERDRTVKRELYESAGVREYWIVDPVAERITVHRREVEAFAPGFELDRASMLTTPQLPGLEVSVADVFLESRTPGG